MRRGLRRPVVVAANIGADAGKAVTNVGGVGDLAEFAVADAVDPGCDLLGDNIPDRSGKVRLECRLIKFAAGLSRLQQGQQLGRSRQAADMGRQDVVAAELHLELLPSKSAPNESRDIRRLFVIPAKPGIRRANIAAVAAGPPPPVPCQGQASRG